MIVCCLTWPCVNAAGSSRRPRQTRRACAPCRGHGSARSAANAIATARRAAPSSTPPFATGRQRAEVRLKLTRHSYCRACGAVFLRSQGYPDDGSVVVVMVTDVPLTELFNREREETSHNSNSSPEAESRLKGSKEQESGGSVRASVTERIISLCVAAFSNISHVLPGAKEV